MLPSPSWLIEYISQPGNGQNCAWSIAKAQTFDVTEVKARAKKEKRKKGDNCHNWSGRWISEPDNRAGKRPLSLAAVIEDNLLPVQPPHTGRMLVIHTLSLRRARLKQESIDKHIHSRRKLVGRKEMAKQGDEVQQSRREKGRHGRYNNQTHLLWSRNPRRKESTWSARRRQARSDEEGFLPALSAAWTSGFRRSSCVTYRYCRSTSALSRSTLLGHWH